MTTINSDEVAESIVKRMKEENHAFLIDHKAHAEQHEFLAILIEERAERQARNARIKERIAGSLILSAMLGLVGLLGAGALDWLKTHLK